ncbi:MAG TPA: thermonuclease family protein [bacterium]|nr:thermonuclease family protein [bacterium]HQO34577.1 thermonuclease family protein [bacterium]HQP97009.1 thermonuclease family protein [bacterium]
MIRLVFLVALSLVVQRADGKELSTPTSRPDRHIEIRDGPPIRSERPSRPASQPSQTVKSATPEAVAPIPPGTTEIVRITKVWDTERIDGPKARLFSLLGIHGFSKREEDPEFAEYGHLAYILVKSLVERETVIVEYDVDSRPIDGRIPAYLFLKDGRFLNRILLENGLALLEEKSAPLKYRTLLEEARKSAQKQGKGYWTRPEENTQSDSR